MSKPDDPSPEPDEQSLDAGQGFDPQGTLAILPAATNAGPAVPSLASAQKTHTSESDESLRPPTGGSGAVRLQPQSIGPYDIVGELGRGAMGVIFEAVHRGLKRRTAIKMILHGEYAGDEALARFAQEAQAVARLHNPGIVQLYEYGEQEGLPWFALEFVDGPTLADLAARRRMTFAEATSIVADLAGIVAYAHSQGVVHRDIKPRNVLMAGGLLPKLADFGLARLSNDESRSLRTQTGMVMGTPGFMSPEQASGNASAIGPLSDQYSLGAVLYFLLVDRAPFGSSNAMQVLYDILERDPVPPREIRSDVPVPLETICLKAMAKDPLQRYPDCRALEADLRRFLRSEPILARSLSALDQVVGSFRQPQRAELRFGGATPELTAERQAELLHRVTSRAEKIAKRERECMLRDAARSKEARRHLVQWRSEALAAFRTEHARLGAEYQRARESVYQQYEREGAALWTTEEAEREAALRRRAAAAEKAEAAAHVKVAALEKASAVEDAGIDGAVAKNEAARAQRREEFEALEQRARALVVELRQSWPDTPISPPAPSDKSRNELFDEVARRLAEARANLDAIGRQPAVNFLAENWPVLIGVFAPLALAFPAWWSLAHYGLGFVALVCAAGAFVGGVGSYAVAHGMVRVGTRWKLDAFREAIAGGLQSLNAAWDMIGQEMEAVKDQNAEKRRQRKDVIDAELADAVRQATAASEQAIAKSAARAWAARKDIEAEREIALDELESRIPEEIAALERDFEASLVRTHRQYAAKRNEHRSELRGGLKRLADEWSDELSQFEAEVDAMNEYCSERYPGWPDRLEAIDGAWPSAVNEIPALPLGRLSFDLAKRARAIPKADGTSKPRALYTFPAIMSYPSRPSLLLLAGRERRVEAAKVMRNVMLRLMTTLPAGKVRFTIIDPVGLGESFSAFMHLTDFQEELVNNRIWTERAHIDQRLIDLSEHMENVIQKYLRNDFASIQEYNRDAGEVAEPFHVLVIANLPENFSEEAARRLGSVASSGARCGVYTIISVDPEQRLPAGIDLPTLENVAATLVWNDARAGFVWKDAPFTDLSLKIDEPPDEEVFTRLICDIGREAQATSKVEIPFRTVTPDDGQWWSLDSREGVQAPLGRAGARKLQYLRLGKGTDQHVLIAGKTGSGKSTLLNAMITTLSSWYAPTELHFYLIDFKKGVEFKAYAAFRLPHARVIAVESEREFGLSVLERLDQELTIRGDLFREAGVQDLKGYRNARPQAAAPRILLVIDEFQEFFTIDDKISHEASLLLDRLVRQGRAFGVHVILGSQTLAGAYSLASATLGQMAVRIALQCSEADSQLILNAENPAARLLSRPGEAIYNDANGTIEGNHPFQIVWLSDSQREEHLRRVAERAEREGLPLPPTIVFDSNIPANPAENEALVHWLTPGEVESSSLLAPRVWLGKAVAIKEPPDAVFLRQGAANLLVVGQNEALALGTMAEIVHALAAQLRRIPPEGSFPMLCLLDGVRPDSPDREFWSQTAALVGSLARRFPPQAAKDLVIRLSAEVDRRLATQEFAAEPIFVVLHNLARFRDLAPVQDFSNASLGADEDLDEASRAFAKLLREGPAVGVHCIVWSDSCSTLTRWLDRAVLRDFDARVLFQMNGADSTTLANSDLASHLGKNYALRFSVETGQSEKFRPYARPTQEWRATLAKRFDAIDRHLSTATPGG